ncbi:MAG: TIGR01777 family oxidoreductase [Gemmatimonadota bacterium]
MAIFRHRSELPYSREEVFDWHMRPGAMERLSPPWMQVRVIRREGEIHDGGRVVLGIRKGPAEIKWEARHTDFQEGKMFRDEQTSGPFGAWVHTHRFLDGEGGGSIMEDEVEWEAPLGTAGKVLGEPFLERDMERLFAFRHARLRHDLDLHARYGSRGPLTVAMTGSSGLVGQALTHLLEGGGHAVVPMSRRPSEKGIFWDPEGGQWQKDALEGMDGVIHLAGEPIFGLRWTQEKKDRIMKSRKTGTEVLSRALAGLKNKPRVLVSASATGFYGDRGSTVMTEKSPPGKGFLAGVCRAWEDATAPARRAGIRVVNVRTGMVLTPAGGALGTMLLPYKLGVGGRLGSGRQYMSWIDLDDETGLIYHALANDAVKGPLNATAPHPVQNSTFTSVLGRVLNRPTLIPVPSLGVKALFGEMGEELLLFGARVLPAKAQDTGYEFRYPSLEESLRFQLGRPET